MELRIDWWLIDLSRIINYSFHELSCHQISLHSNLNAAINLLCSICCNLIVDLFDFIQWLKTFNQWINQRNQINLIKLMQQIIEEHWLSLQQEKEWIESRMNNDGWNEWNWTGLNESKLNSNQFAGLMPKERNKFKINNYVFHFWFQPDWISLIYFISFWFKTLNPN